MADGSVTFDTRLDNSKLEKDLNSTAKKIDSLNQKIAQKEAARAPIVEALKDANKQAVEAYNNVERLQSRLAASQAATTSGNLGPTAYMQELENQKQIKEELAEQEKILKKKEAAAQRLADKDAKAVQAIETQTAALEREKEKAGQLQTQLEQAQKMAPLNNALAGVEGRIDKLGKRIMGLAKRVFVFTLITAALCGVRSYMGQVIGSSDEASAAMARLKGALLTMAQPLMDVVIPAFTAFINVLTRIVTAIAGLMSALFGKTIDQSAEAAENLYNEANAIKETGSAAKKASGFLASFDEVNQVQDDSTSGGSGSSVKAPGFTLDTSTMEADFDKILGWIKLIGAALLAWKLSDTFLGGLKMFIGLIIAINGAIEMAKGAWDAFNNGLDGNNLQQMLLGLLELVAGLGIAFGPVGAAVGLIVGGLVLLATSLYDVTQNGWNLYNMLGTIAGIMAAGCGIAILTGSWIPLLIAAIVSLLVALAVNTGHGEELINGIKDVCQGFLDFITGIFSGDIDKALGGVVQMFEGLKAVALAMVDGVKDTLLSFLDWLDGKTNGEFHTTIETAKKFITDFFNGVKQFASELIDNLKLIFTGIVEFVSGVFTNDWDKAWNGVKDIFKGVINGIITIFEAMINKVIGGLNIVIRGIRKFTAFSLPDWMGGYKFGGISIPEISKVSIPRLASGAVIPPNREFMAVLGDQTIGNNLEAPESLIRQIVREESGSNSQTVVLLRAILEAIKDGKVLMVDKRVLGKIAAEAMGNAARSSGTSVIPV